MCGFGVRICTVRFESSARRVGGDAVSKSKRLRTRELRRLFYLLGECCELGADPLAWRRHLVERLPALFDAQVGQQMEVQVAAPPFQRPFWLALLSHHDFGWATPSDRRGLEAHLATGRPEDGPHITPDLLRRRLKSFHWCGDLGQTAWHEGAFFNEFVRQARVDDGLFAHHLIAPGRMRWLFVNRALGDKPFGEREHRLMRLLNVELARLLGTRLARIGEPTVTDLPPRQRDVLVCLMNGDTEKQAARRLGISPHTVHDYVKALHGRFGVRSRGELLARCRAFWPLLERLAAEQEDLPPSAVNELRGNGEPPSGD